MLWHFFINPKKSQRQQHQHSVQ